MGPAVNSAALQSWSSKLFPATQSTYTSIELGPRESSSQGMSYIDKANGTRIACIVSLGLSTIFGIAFVVVGACADGSDMTYNFSPVAREVIPLGINVVVLVVTETLGYIHAVSLRWALFYENTLEFNANLRLLTFSKKSLPNGITCNVVFFICIALCYAGTPLILIQNTYSYYQTDGATPWSAVSHSTSLSRVVPMVIGVAILVQCVLSAWCILGSRIPSWSSDPLNTLAIAMSEGMTRERGRAMMSVHSRRKPSVPTAAIARQQSAYAVDKKVVWILGVAVGVLCGLIIWTAIIVHISNTTKNGGSWAFIPTPTVNVLENGHPNDRNQTLTVFLSFFANSGSPVIVPEAVMAGVLFFNMAIQGVITIGLHCAELQVTLTRDEAVWRGISAAHGSVENSLYYSALRPFQSWQSLGLLAFKPIIHWLYGSAMKADYAQGVLMHVPHITYLTASWAVFLCFLALVSLDLPRGPLPATYGHLKTMVDIVDVWAERLYWGDKTEGDGSEGVRHSGTGGRKLPPVVLGALYT